MKKQKDLVIIKVYRNNDTSDLRDLMLDELGENIKELKEFGDQIKKEIFFTVLDASELSETNLTTFAEIEYTGELSPDEKEYYIETIKHFTISGEYNYKKRSLEIIKHNDLQGVIFKKLTNEEYVCF